MQQELFSDLAACNKDGEEQILRTILSLLEYNHVCSVIETKATKIKDERNSSTLKKKFSNFKRKFGIPKVSRVVDFGT